MISGITLLVDQKARVDAQLQVGGVTTTVEVSGAAPLVETKTASVGTVIGEREVFDLLKPHWMCDYDDAGSIGRRYRRQDEVGTPFCVTVDFDTLDDRAATVRDRDSMIQERIPVVSLVEHLRERL